MEPGIWLGRAEDSDEHLVGTPRGVYRCRTVRRHVPDKQWGAELFLSIKGAPWDTAQGAVPRAAAARRVHFALPPCEVVRQPDARLLTHGLPAELPVEEPGDDGPHEALSLEAPSAPVEASAASPRRETAKRGGEGPTEDQEQEQKPLTLPSPTGTKRSAETSLDVLDPRSPAHQEADQQVLQVEVGAHVDEDPVELPPDSFEHLALDGEAPSADHPDTWDEARWQEESAKGKANKLSRLASYGVYKAVLRSEATGKHVTTRWEEVPKLKSGKWVVRSRFVAREFRWQQPYRDDVFGVTSSSNTARVLDLLLAKNPSWNAYAADVECAFFHAPEREECIVDPPQEWLDENPGDWVWKLLKQLYGRQKAPREFGASTLVEGLAFDRCVEVTVRSKWPWKFT